MYILRMSKREDLLKMLVNSIPVAQREVVSEIGRLELVYYVNKINYEGNIAYGIRIEQIPTGDVSEENTWNAWTTSYEEAEKWALMMADAIVMPSMLQELFIDLVV